MSALEIIVIIVAASIVLSVVGTYIYRKCKHLPTGECASCGSKGKKLISDYYKANPKCSCNKK